MTAEPSHHSVDGRWWWDGTAWLPAMSWDGRWWWDGQSWRPTVRPRFRWPRWLVVAEALWLLVLLAVPVCSLVLFSQHRDGHLPRSEWVLLAVLASLAVMGTLALGFVLGKRRLWVHVPLAAGVGTALLAVLYVAAMVAFADPNDSTTDNAAGAGLVIFGVPTALGLAVLLAMPAAVGWLVARRGDRDSELGARR